MYTNLHLQPNEGIIIQSNSVRHKHYHSELYLTNLNIICVEEITGVFRRTTYNVIKYPVNQIKLVNNQPQVNVFLDDGSWKLQILFRNSIEEFDFYYDFFEKSKRKTETTNWIDQIKILVTGENPPEPTEDSVLNNVKNVLDSSIKTVLGTVGIKTAPSASGKTTIKCMGCMAPLTGNKGQTVCCKYCNIEQTL